MSVARAQRAQAGTAMSRFPGARFRITLMKDGRGINLTRDRKTGEERLLTAEEVLERRGELAWRNAKGWNVYVTPFHQKHHYLVLDDLTVATARQLAKDGYTPHLLQRTSPGNFQGILVADQVVHDREREAANAWVREMNRTYGDPKFTGAVHPFRLAGFMNRKPKHENDGRYPIVRVMDAPEPDASQVNADLEAHRRRLERRPRAAAGVVWTQIDPDDVIGDDRFAAARRQHRQIRRDLERHVERRGWTVDHSRIDFNAARTLLSRGHAPNEVAAVLHLDSPALSERHPDTGTYVRRTVANASRRLGSLTEPAVAPEVSPELLAGYKERYDTERKLAEKLGWTVNPTRVDLRVTRHLLSEGRRPEELQALLVAHSNARDVVSDPERHARRTVQVARREGTPER